MATLFIEGFDEYGPSQGYGPYGGQSNLLMFLAEGGWAVGANTSTNITSSLSGAPGWAVLLCPTTFLIGEITRSLGSNINRVIGGCRIQPNTARDNGIVFYDNTTAQCSIIVQNTTGIVAVCEGSDGTVLQSSSLSIGNLTTHYLEWDVVFNSSETLGGWTVWLDGAPILQGVGITQQSTNASANAIALATYGNEGGTLGLGYAAFDDLYVFDTTTDYNNSALLSSPVVLTQTPTSDVATQWSNQGNVVGNYYPELTTNSQEDVFANSLYLLPITPEVNCVLTALELWVVTANGSADVRPLLYNDNAGKPNALLTAGSALTGVSVGVNQLAVTTPQSLTAKTQYWIGFMTDTTVAIQEFATGVDFGAKASYTYGSEPPSTAPSMTYGQPSAAIYAVCVDATTDWQSLATNPPQGDISMTDSGLSGTADLFKVQAMPLGVLDIYTVVVRGHCALQASASLDFLLLVGTVFGVINYGSNGPITPTTTYTWYDTVFDTEPGNINGNWAPDDVSGCIIGMQVFAS